MNGGKIALDGIVDKPIKKEPNFILHVLLSVFIYLLFYGVSVYRLGLYGLALYLFIPFFSCVISVTIYCIKKEANQLEVFTLSMAPGLAILISVMSIGDGLLFILAIPFILPVSYFGGLLGHAIGSAVGCFTNDNFMS